MSYLAHIFFDNAYDPAPEVGPNATKVNRFVRDLVNTIDVAASLVHETEVNLRAPKKLPTPYGGQLVWTLPGKTKLIVHLKDKDKIRIKKRWSQVTNYFILILTL
jgi:chitin synthase